MFKQLLTIATLLCLLTSPVMAANLQPPNNPENENLDNAVNLKEVVDKFPPAKTGVGFSLVENNLNFLTEFEVATWNGFSLNIGYAGAQPTTGHKAIASIEYDLFNAQQHGVTLPILKYIDLSLGVWGGAGHFDNAIELQKAETDWGLSATAVKFRFW